MNRLEYITMIMRAEMLVQLIVLEHYRCSGSGMNRQEVLFGQKRRKELHHGKNILDACNDGKHRID